MLFEYIYSNDFYYCVISWTDSCLNCPSHFATFLVIKRGYVIIILLWSFSILFLLYNIQCTTLFTCTCTQIIGKVGVGNGVGISVALLLLVAFIVVIVAALIYDSRKMKRHASWQESSSAPLDVENGNVVSDIFNGTVYEA